MAETSMLTKDPEMESCIDECQECHEVCLETVQYCLEQGGDHAAPEHIRLLLDCAEICQTSANFMIRGSDLHGETCRACAAACEACAESCEQFGDDERMNECARTCRECAESCREMAAG